VKTPAVADENTCGTEAEFMATRTRGAAIDVIFLIMKFLSDYVDAVKS